MPSRKKTKAQPMKARVQSLTSVEALVKARKKALTNRKRTKAQLAKGIVESLPSIEALVKGGTAVISGDDTVIVTAVQDAVIGARTATFFVPRNQFNMVMLWYFTNERIERLGMELATKEERTRIETKLGVKIAGSIYSNRIECGCGAEYGAIEFIEQGIREHGIDMVRSVLEQDELSVIRVNPPTVAICSQCNQQLLAGHYYCMSGYGCCREM